ncbi:MAG: PAS domain-containing hybrid sensor histidine kinase/response regulator [Candidatus Rokuibacteriota bacterium]
MSALLNGLLQRLRGRRQPVPDLLAATVRLAAIVRSSDDAIVSKDLNGTIASWNPGAEKMFGFTAAEAVGRSITIIIPPDRHAEEDDVLARIGRGEVVEHFETVRMRKDGSRLDISLTVSPVKSATGAIIGASKIARDISEHKRHDAHLTLLARAGELLASSLDYEATLRQVAGLAVPDMADGCAVDLLAPDGSLQRVAIRHRDPDAEVLAWEASRRFQRPAGHPLLRVVRSGQPELCELVTETQRAALGPDPAYVAKVLGPQDLAGRAAQAIENARLYREVETANRRKDEFLAVLSHELRTPLNSVLGWSRMLRDGSLEASAIPRALDAIGRNAEAQVRLIEDLLDISRIVTGKMRLDARAMDPMTAVEAALEVVRPAAEAKAIRLQAILDPRAGPISGDRERLQQVVWNLLSNATKFTPKGGRIQVRLERVNSHIEIVVSDTGQGIPADLLPRVFDHFRQGDSSSTRAHGGLGLGLALVKHLVESHGGSVEAASPGEGHGATFTVKRPLMVHAELALSPDRVHPTAEKPLAGVGDRGPLSSLAGIRVLAVDDDGDALELLARLLEAQGAEVQTAPSAAPAVALTAYGRAVDRIRALAAGFNMHVAKPFQPTELVAVIVRLTRGDRA